MTDDEARGEPPLVRIERPVDHVATIVLDRPGQLNAVDTALALQLAAACTALRGEPGLRAVVLTTSQAKAFSVGADLKERLRLTDAELAQQRELTRAAYGGVLALPVPVVAAVEGYALGGGLELALACDLVVAGAASVLGLPEVSVGVIPGGGGTQLLARRVGWSRAASLIFTARRVTAQEAAQLGVVDEVVPAGMAAVRGLELATAIAAHSPVAVRNAKKAMRLGLDVDLAAGLEVEDACWRATAFSVDRAEGVRAFVEHRPPAWPSA